MEMAWAFGNDEYCKDEEGIYIYRLGDKKEGNLKKM